MVRDDTRRRQGFLGRLAQQPDERPPASRPDQRALAEVARNLGFVLNTRKACGSVLPDFGLGEYEHEVNTHLAIEALRLEMLDAVSRHEPRMSRPALRLLGGHGYDRVRYELAGVVEGRACTLGIDIDTTTRHVDVLLPAGDR